MNEFKIFIQDLNEETQKRLIEFLGGENGNYDVIPILTLTNEKMFTRSDY